MDQPSDKERIERLEHLVAQLGGEGAGLTQSGTGTLAAGTLVVNAPAGLRAGSRIFVTMKDPGAGAITGLGALDVPAGTRNTGTGNFTVNAIDDAKAVINTAVCTFDWLVVG